VADPAYGCTFTRPLGTVDEGDTSKATRPGAAAARPCPP